MSEFNTNVYESTGESLRAYITKVFTKMGIALALTAAVAFFGYQSFMSGGFFYQLLVRHTWIIYGFAFAEIGIVIALSAGLNKLSPMTAQILFYVYAVITGLTFTTLPLAYGISNVFTAFIFAAVLFVSCAVIGHTTNVDLTKYSGLLMGGLIALVLMTVVSLFIPALRNSLIIGYIGLALFLVITAFDMQKIKAFYYNIPDGDLKENAATYGALQLYLDFINIFLYVLRILGRNSKN